jgi:hypothetical protein
MTKDNNFAKIKLSKQKKQEILSRSFKLGITWKQAKLMQLENAKKAN